MATSISPAPSVEEAAAIAAAVARFRLETAAPAPSDTVAQSPWKRAALEEGVDRATPFWGKRM